MIWVASVTPGAVTGPVAPTRHAGKPTRKSANDLNDTFMNDDPGVEASFLMRCASKPARNVCMPCDQEI